MILQSTQPEFAVVVSHDTTDLVRVTVTGEVDVMTAPMLRAAIGAATAHWPIRLELDLSGVTFYSCAGLETLVEARRACGDLLTIVANPVVVRLATLADVTEQVGLSAPVAEPAPA